MILVIDTNKNGKIEYTKEQLEDLLKKAYDEGYEEGLKRTVITYPWRPTYYTTNTTPNWQFVTGTTTGNPVEQQGYTTSTNNKDGIYTLKKESV